MPMNPPSRRVFLSFLGGLAIAVVVARLTTLFRKRGDSSSSLQLRSHYPELSWAEPPPPPKGMSSTPADDDDTLTGRVATAADFGATHTLYATVC